MSKDLADIVAADPLALAPDKAEYEEKYAEPMERIARTEEELKEEKKALKDQLTKLWGLHPAAHGLADKLHKMKPDDRIRVLKGAALLLRHQGQELPEDLFHADGLEPGRGIAEGANSPVFDGTSAGKATARKPRSKRGESDDNAARQVQAVEPGIPLEDARRAFEENQHKAPKATFPTEEEVEAKHAEIEAQRAEDEQAFEEPEAKADDAAPVKRRGRKPGSKNKPKDGAPTPVQEAADRAERRAEQEKLKQRTAATEEKVEAKLNEPPVFDIDDELDEPPKWALGNVRPIGRALVEF